ncbi:MAG: hypothetical protein ACTHKQ_11870 [Mesorhizobium sp.]
MTLYLVKNNVPFDVAFSLGPAEKLAYVVVIGEMDSGKRFNWATRTWVKRSPNE